MSPFDHLASMVLSLVCANKEEQARRVLLIPFQRPLNTEAETANLLPFQGDVL